MPEEGLEPSRLAARGSKPRVSANSTTPAGMFFGIQGSNLGPSDSESDALPTKLIPNSGLQVSKKQRSEKIMLTNLVTQFAGVGIEPTTSGLWARRDTTSPPRIITIYWESGVLGLEPRITGSKPGALPTWLYPKERGGIVPPKTYLLLHCGDFLAFFNHGFLRSLTLGSLFRSPYGFSFNLLDSFHNTSPLENQSLIASAWPISHQPFTTISASKERWFFFHITVKGIRASSIIYAWPPKYSLRVINSQFFLTLKEPVPLG